MADRYVRSTDGADADSGATWALARATLAGIAAIDTAGDRLFVSGSHAESTATTQTLSFAGTAANPVQILCANDAAEPPTALATTGTMACTADIYFYGHIYVYGLTVSSGTGTAATYIICGDTAAANAQTWESCTFKLISTGGSSRILVNNASSSIACARVVWRNCDVSFGGTSHGMSPTHVEFDWIGGKILAGSSALTTGSTALFVPGSSYMRNNTVRVIGVDLTNLGASTPALVNVSGLSGEFTFRNCKLPSGWTGRPMIGAIIGVGDRVSLYNCDAGDTNYRLWIDDYAGTIRDETTVVRTGGASDGTTPLAWKMVSNASATEHTTPLSSDEIVIWNESIGTPKTLTVQILHDSTTALTDAEIWIDVTYQGTSGAPLSLTATDKRASVLTAAADQEASAVAWTTTGLTNPNKQKLTVTFTPQENGFVSARVRLGKPSKTVYVCPKAELA